MVLFGGDRVCWMEPMCEWAFGLCLCMAGLMGELLGVRSRVFIRIYDMCTVPQRAFSADLAVFVFGPG